MWLLYLHFYVDAGLKASEAEQTVLSLMSIPVLSVSSADFVVDGEIDGTPVLEEDIVTCSFRVILSRAAHSQPGTPVSSA